MSTANGAPHTLPLSELRATTALAGRRPGGAAAGMTHDDCGMYSAVEQTQAILGQRA